MAMPVFKQSLQLLQHHLISNQLSLCCNCSLNNRGARIYRVVEMNVCVLTWDSGYVVRNCTVERHYWGKYVIGRMSHRLQTTSHSREATDSSGSLEAHCLLLNNPDTNFYICVSPPTAGSIHFTFLKIAIPF